MAKFSKIAYTSPICRADDDYPVKEVHKMRKIFRKAAVRFAGSHHLDMTHY